VLRRSFQDAARAAGITRRVTPHALRHNAECWIIPSGGPDGVEIRASL
jgi:integrase